MTKNLHLCWRERWFHTKKSKSSPTLSINQFLSFLYIIHHGLIECCGYYFCTNDSVIHRILSLSLNVCMYVCMSVCMSACMLTQWKTSSICPVCVCVCVCVCVNYYSYLFCYIIILFWCSYYIALIGAHTV